MKNKEKQNQLHSERTKTKNDFPSAIRLVYCQLVFFKNFIDPAKPLVICEGPTDAVYYKCAIHNLVAAHPALASEKDGKLTFNVNFFKYSKQSRDLLQLRGGSGDLKFFIAAWKGKFAKFKYRPMNHPVIVLIDNDDGAKDIFSFLQGKKTFGITIGLESDLAFYHLSGPLYLVKTPIKGKDYKSCPEDFFDSALLATKIDGKTFSPDKEHEAPGEYGKVWFAERVVRPNASTINFTGFDPLLTRIDAVIEDYAKRKAATG